MYNSPPQGCGLSWLEVIEIEQGETAISDRKRRTIRQIGLALVLACVTQVVMGLLISILASHPPYVRAGRVRVLEHKEWPYVVPDSWPDHYLEHSFTSNAMMDVAAYFHVATEGEAEGSLWLLEKTSLGWPWRCFAFTRWDSSFKQRVLVVDGLLIGRVGRYGNPRFCIPLRVQPVGLAANIALAWVLWFLVLLSASEIRRAFLRRRGRCTSCGYQVDNLDTCPECGSSRVALGGR